MKEEIIYLIIARNDRRNCRLRYLWFDRQILVYCRVIWYRHVVIRSRSIIDTCAKYFIIVGSTLAGSHLLADLPIDSVVIGQSDYPLWLNSCTNNNYRWILLFYYSYPMRKYNENKYYYYTFCFNVSIHLVLTFISVQLLIIIHFYSGRRF